MADRANTSDPCMNFASCTTPSRPISTCKTTLPRCPLALADSGYAASIGCDSKSHNVDSGSFTGSIDDIAAPNGLAPLPSGVIEAVCDLRLDGMFPGAASSCAGAEFRWGALIETGCRSARGAGGEMVSCGGGTAEEVRAGSTGALATGATPS